ncbi:MAG TPA: lamin tail domain-containing protein [Chitinophagales bacterium]|nr:lamin tail domain-containing protein [Chitinophagales bacterium]
MKLTSTLLLTALFYCCAAHAQNLVITEIFYNTPGSGNDTIEYLEIKNHSTVPVNLDGYQLATAVTFTFPPLTLQPDSFLIISKFAPHTLQCLNKPSQQWTSGSLNNAGELIELFDAQGGLVDSVRFSPDAFGWDTLADGGGYALVLCDADLDNAVASNWKVVHEYMGFFVDSLFGNPGRGCLAETTDTTTSAHYMPGNEMITAANNGVYLAGISRPKQLEVFNVLGVQCFTALVENDGFIPLSQLQTGLYFVRLRSGSESETVRFVR